MTASTAESATSPTTSIAIPIAMRTIVVRRDMKRIMPLEVKHDRDGALVDELDRHARAEDPRLDGDSERPQLSAETLVELLGPLGRRRLREARPVSLRRVGDQRELGDHERRAADVQQRAVELAVLVLEDPQPDDLAGEPLGF